MYNIFHIYNTNTKFKLKMHNQIYTKSVSKICPKDTISKHWSFVIDWRRTNRFQWRSNGPDVKIPRSSLHFILFLSFRSLCIVLRNFIRLSITITTIFHLTLLSFHPIGKHSFESYRIYRKMWNYLPHHLLRKQISWFRYFELCKTIDELSCWQMTQRTKGTFICRSYMKTP